MNDPYESGTPKYSTATAIYDALCVLEAGEEMGILSEMFADVSWENQDYYYQDLGSKLKERFEELSDYGSKMWILDLAITQMGLNANDFSIEIHDTIYEALIDMDLAKRIGFKKLFIDTVLYGEKSLYDDLSKAFEEELQELNRFDFWGMTSALYNADQKTRKRYFKPPSMEYNRLCDSVKNKVINLQLQKETQKIVECRALLTSYDDFIYGLRMNQELFNQQERLYGIRLAELQESYQKQVERLMLMAEMQGVNLSLGDDAKMLVEGRGTVV
jgi:hypothetical protein